ncbi:hypothetical protein RJT34_13580 [Clitoria ternatea]|uniref:Uncharacterized protein n=1 Tax=Clitoria ternatea TaxID=43366 RepID=A0AAN9JNT3_CLITE
MEKTRFNLSLAKEAVHGPGSNVAAELFSTRGWIMILIDEEWARVKDGKRLKGAIVIRRGEFVARFKREV